MKFIRLEHKDGVTYIPKHAELSEIEVYLRTKHNYTCPYTAMVGFDAFLRLQENGIEVHGKDNSVMFVPR